MNRVASILVLLLFVAVPFDNISYAQRGKVTSKQLQSFIANADWQPSKPGMRLAKAFLQRQINEDRKSGRVPTQKLFADNVTELKLPRTWLHTLDAPVFKQQIMVLAVMLTGGPTLEKLRDSIYNQFINAKLSLDERFETLYSIAALVERLGIRSESDTQLERLGPLVIGPPAEDEKERNRQAAYIAIEMLNARDFALTWGSVYFHALTGTSKAYKSYSFKNFFDNSPPKRNVRIFDALPKKFRRINKLKIFSKSVYYAGEDLIKAANSHSLTPLIKEELDKMGIDLLLDTSRFNVLQSKQDGAPVFQLKDAAAITTKNEETGRITVIARGDVTLLILLAELHVVNVIMNRYDGVIPWDPMDLTYRQRLGALERESNYAALYLAQKYGIQLSRKRMEIGYDAINRAFQNFDPDRYSKILKNLKLEP